MNNTLNYNIFSGTYHNISQECYFNVSFQGQVTSGSNYSQMRLNSINFIDSIFQSSYFEDVIFENCNFTNCNMSFVEFKNCTFINCKFNDSHFSQTNFKNCSFEKSKFNGSFWENGSNLGSTISNSYLCPNSLEHFEDILPKDILSTLPEFFIMVA